MPYPEDFDAAAATLDAAAVMAGTLVQPAQAAMGTGVMVGGQLTDLVTEELAAADTILQQVVDELSQLAGVCRERAEVARLALAAQQDYQVAYADYESDLRQWQADSDAYAASATTHDPGPPPDPPREPEAAPAWANR